MTADTTRVIIYGGNGFVGSHIAQALHQKATVTCVSRSGKMPEHLVGDLWPTKVVWMRGDAADADPELLEQHDVVITTVGAPPLPTLTKKGFAQSVHTNGEVNRELLKTAAAAGIKRAVVIGAKIPGILNKPWFAYAVGKQISFEAAQDFSQSSKQHHATVFQPGGIYGTRHTASGTPIPLGAVMGPLAKLMPSQLIAVERLAARAAATALGKSPEAENFMVVPHSEI
jgi:nucleoside-diphosphate-sugar epimerase